MAECTVCKGDREPGRTCRRCGSDNASWEKWQEERPEEQDGLAGLLAFIAPHAYLPLIITLLALGCGLMGLGGAWRGIQWGIQLLAVLFTVCGCLIVTQWNYGRRHTIRERQLLNQVRWKWGALAGDVKLWAMILPALSLLIVLLLAFLLVTSDLLWELARWLLFEPGYAGLPMEGGVRDRIVPIWPLLLLVAYCGFTVPFVYSSSALLALRYAGEMNQALPLPIFLNGDMLAELVRRQAERQLARPGGFTVRTARSQIRWTVEAERKDEKGSAGGEGPSFSTIPVSGNLLVAAETPAQPSPSTMLAVPPGLQRLRGWHETVEHVGQWNWEEVERTPDGGIVMKARGEERIESTETDLGFRQSEAMSVVYTVTADPWGRIRKISRGVEKATG
ncbi:MAG TPA: hypothetical protein EYH30_07875 [Anaerolineales bacterium]|nr:hypothetical protein [Anaerolineae bacterium]HIQ02032.1 hypothetical protein [Anaerolineales bacterium]